MSHNPDGDVEFQQINKRGPLDWGLRIDGPFLSREPKQEIQRGLTHHGKHTLAVQNQNGSTVVKLRGNFPVLHSGAEREVVNGVTLVPGTPDGAARVLVASSEGLLLYNAATGALLRRYQGHSTGGVHSVACSPSGRFAVSGGSDEVIRLWNVATGELLLNVYNQDADWVAWTPTGHYAASPNGQRLIGWQVNQGEGKDPDFHAGTDFPGFHAPEVIKRLLETGNVEGALPQTGHANVSVGEALPPVIEVVEPGADRMTIDDGRLKISAAARSRSKNFPIRRLVLRINGSTYWGAGGRRNIPQDDLDLDGGTVRAQWELEVPPGRHTIDVLASTASSTSVSRGIVVDYREANKGRLYVLAIGIDDYQDPQVNNLQFAVRDAQVFSETMQQRARKLYQPITIRQLLNREATCAAIIHELEQLKCNVSPEDVGVVLFSGHGVTSGDGSRFFLAGSDLKRNAIAGTGVSSEEVHRQLSRIPGRAVLLVDACHAAGIGDIGRASVGLNNDLVHRLVDRESGVSVLCSSEPGQASYENPGRKHGNFTYAVIEGLKGQADQGIGGRPPAGIVFTNELAIYVLQRVQQLDNRQRPRDGKPLSMSHFPLTTVGQKQ